MDMTRTDLQVLREIRRSRVPIAKAVIAQSTGLSLSTVTEYVRRFVGANLVTEVATGISTGGRRPQLLSFNAQAGYVVMVDLESTHVQVGVADFAASLLASDSGDVDVAAGPPVVLDSIKDMVVSLLSQLHIDPSQIKGIGMGVPGPVEFSSGLPASLPIMPGWDRYPIRRYWAQHFACPCYVDNNVNTMAIGEHAAAATLGADDLLFIKTGNGIGAGIIVNGQIFRGAQECAGNIGHIDIGHDVPCYCGNRGCLEAVAGGRAIVARAAEIARQGHSPMLAEILAANGKLRMSDVMLAVQSSDIAVIELIRECGAQVGQVLAGLVTFFNPSHIYIGGNVAEVGDLLLAAIRQAVYNRSLPLATRNLVIRQSALGETVGLIGAAVMTVDQLLMEDLSRPEGASLDQRT